MISQRRILRESMKKRGSKTSFRLPTLGHIFAGYLFVLSIQGLVQLYAWSGWYALETFIRVIPPFTLLSFSLLLGLTAISIYLISEKHLLVLDFEASDRWPIRARLALPQLLMITLPVLLFAYLIHSRVLYLAVGFVYALEFAKKKANALPLLVVVPIVYPFVASALSTSFSRLHSVPYLLLAGIAVSKRYWLVGAILVSYAAMLYFNALYYRNMRLNYSAALMFTPGFFMQQDAMETIAKVPLGLGEMQGAFVLNEGVNLEGYIEANLRSLSVDRSAAISNFSYLYSFNPIFNISPDVLGLPMSFFAAQFYYLGYLGFVSLLVYGYLLNFVCGAVASGLSRAGSRYTLALILYGLSFLVTLLAFHTAIFGITKFILMMSLLAIWLRKRFRWGGKTTTCRH